MTITYLVDGYYNPADELGVAWDDPAIGADWGVTDPILSERDQANPRRADLDPAVVPTQRCAPEVPMRLFVTGGAGFIGSNYVRHVLATSDDEVTVFDALTYAGNRENLADVEQDPRFAFVQGDICDRMRSSTRCSPATTPSSTSRPRATSTARSLDPDVFVRTNCDGTNVVCDIAAVIEVERFLHISTDEVYGSIEEGPSSRPTGSSPARRTRRRRRART